MYWFAKPCKRGVADNGRRVQARRCGGGATAPFSPHAYLRKALVSVVARDGIEPPPPAFSGPPTDPAKWFGISGSV